jgi:hypothetical protein
VPATILAGIGEIAGLLDILDRDHAAQLEVPVDHQHLLDTVPVQQVFDLLAVSPLQHSDQAILGGHDRADRGLQAGFETQIAMGDDPHQVLPLHHRHTGDVVGPGQLQNISDAHLWRDRDGLLDHPALVFLHHPHLVGLLLRGHVLVDHAEPALLGDGDRQRPFGDRVHGRGQQRHVEFDVAGQAGLELGLPGQDTGMCRHQRDVVKGQGFLDDAHGVPHGNEPVIIGPDRGMVNS